MSENGELEFSTEAQRRFKEIDPQNYDLELKRLRRRSSQLRLGHNFLLLLILATLMLAPTVATAVGPGFALLWLAVMGTSLVQAFRHMDKHSVLGEVRHLILRERLKRAPVSSTLSFNKRPGKIDE